MPPTNRPRLLNSQQSPHNPINNNTPPPNILYTIVNPATKPQPTPLKPPPETEDKKLRRINREARMKANQERRNNRQQPPKPNIYLPPDNIKNDLITPPPNDIKNDVVLPPIDIMKDGGNEGVKTLTQLKFNKNLYLIGGAGILAAIILMKK